MRFLVGHLAALGAAALASLMSAVNLGAARGDDSLTSRGIVNPLHFAPKAKRIIWLYMAGGPSHLETFDYKPKLARDARPADARVVHQGPADRAAAGRQAELLRPAASRSRSTASRARRCFESFRTSARCRRRHLHHPLDAHRGDQSRPGPHVHEHRHDDLRPAGDGLVADVRPGQREPTTCPASSC